MLNININQPKIAMRRVRQWAAAGNCSFQEAERICLALSEYERNRGTQGEEASRKDVATSLAAIGVVL